MMVPAAAADPTLQSLIPLLESDDAIIDGGNSYYHDDIWGSERGYYHTREFGELVYDRVEMPATPEQKKRLAKLSPQHVELTELAGDQIQTVLTSAPGNGAPIGGLKVVAECGWFAARPLGTVRIHKIYAKSFRGVDQLRRIQEEAQTIVGDALAAPSREKS